mmetsp:Transcript_101908/g.283875  ORF Transcript_101908/g.283875 Transcript_101908/m.283875 type:complete len:236 (-) Transcript_101908:4-711(-)
MEVLEASEERGRLVVEPQKPQAPEDPRYAEPIVVAREARVPTAGHALVVVRRLLDDARCGPALSCIHAQLQAQKIEEPLEVATHRGNYVAVGDRAFPQLRREQGGAMVVPRGLVDGEEPLDVVVDLLHLVKVPCEDVLQSPPLAVDARAPEEREEVPRADGQPVAAPLHACRTAAGRPAQERALWLRRLTAAILKSSGVGSIIRNVKALRGRGNLAFRQRAVHWSGDSGNGPMEA